TQIPQMKQIFTDCCNEMKIYLQCTSFFQNLPFALCPLPFALCPLPFAKRNYNLKEQKALRS
ncbi:MAG: hypothetical protein KDH84_00625, partial [Calditrichaeota bacterium]|nr:hypothetical protein [Calditrichota bacterium]